MTPRFTLFAVVLLALPLAACKSKTTAAVTAQCRTLSKQAVKNKEESYRLISGRVLEVQSGTWPPAGAPAHGRTYDMLQFALDKSNLGSEAFWVYTVFDGKTQPLSIEKGRSYAMCGRNSKKGQDVFYEIRAETVKRREDDAAE